MNAADRLFSAIEHGDDNHREWLRKALIDWFESDQLAPEITTLRADLAASREQAEKLAEALDGVLEHFAPPVYESSPWHVAQRGAFQKAKTALAEYREAKP